MIAMQSLKDAERVVRLTMIVILLVAGTSKFFSQGGFFEYYSALFQGDLRIRLPAWMADTFLRLIPYIEITLAVALAFERSRQQAIYGWFAFMLCLLFGHYVLQEWSAVNQMLDYIFLGLLCLILPNHAAWWRRDTVATA